MFCGLADSIVSASRVLIRRIESAASCEVGQRPGVVSVAILVDYEVEGERLWNRFRTRRKEDQTWYYGELVRVFEERSATLGDVGLQQLLRQLAAVVEAIKNHTPPE